MDLKREALKEDTYILINPAGRFAISGPAGDSRLTGRKIVVDTYGGGAFSGKDPTKADRSAAYAAGYVAKISSLRELTRKEGIFAGSSSGPALAAAKKFALAANNKPPRRSFMLRRGGLLRGMPMQFGDLCGVGIHLLSCGHLRLWSIKAKRCFMFRFPDPARRYTGRTGTTSSDSG